MGFNPKGEPLLLSRKYIHPIILYLVLVAGCTIAPNPEPLPDQRSTVTLTSTTIPVPTLALPASMPETTLVQEPRSTTAFTYQQPDGNRIAIGYGGMPAEPLDIQLSGKPLWVIGAPVPGGSLWVAALESGQVQAFQIEDSEVIEIELNLTTLPPGMPPVMRALGNQVELLTPTPDASPIYSPNLAAGEHSGLYRHARQVTYNRARRNIHTKWVRATRCAHFIRWHGSPALSIRSH